jgi:hypothetical protein
VCWRLAGPDKHATPSTRRTALAGARPHTQGPGYDGKKLVGSLGADNRYFDFDKLAEVTREVTRNLNKIIDVNYYPTESARRSNTRHRPIGLGVQVCRRVRLARVLARVFVPDAFAWARGCVAPSGLAAGCARACTCLFACPSHTMRARVAACVPAHPLPTTRRAWRTPSCCWACPLTAARRRS